MMADISVDFPEFTFAPYEPQPAIQFKRLNTGSEGEKTTLSSQYIIPPNVDTSVNIEFSAVLMRQIDVGGLEGPTGYATLLLSTDYIGPTGILGATSASRPIEPYEQNIFTTTAELPGTGLITNGRYLTTVTGTLSATPWDSSECMGLYIYESLYRRPYTAQSNRTFYRYQYFSIFSQI
jgi:hypothetical protein